MLGKAIFETEHCVGCRTCEIVCSYHHKKIFSPSISSIEIKQDGKEPSFTISFYEIDHNGRLACDGCKAEDEPLCVKYCNARARDEVKTLLNKFLSSR